MKIIPGLALVALLVQCEKEREVVDYFPLKVGNEYCFSSSNDILQCWKEKVWFSTRREGKTWYAFSRDSLRNHWFYRKKPGTGDVYMLDLEELGEWRRYRFDTAAGDTFHTQLDYESEIEVIGTVVSRSDTVTTPAGVFMDCICIVAEDAWGHELWEWFAPEVGRVQLAHEEGLYQLARAQIDGVKYPPDP